MKLSVNAAKVLEKRYLKRDENGKIVETPSQMFRRVADNIAKADELYGVTREEAKKTADAFYEIMSNLEFLPNSPTLMNAGTQIQQLSSCFVLPVEDSLEKIFDTLKNTAIIQQTGGGTGFSFSRIRPRGDIVKSTGGTASGPMSFLKVFNTVTEAVKQGGRRRGANMGILRVDHPDIVEFVISKEKDESLANFNLSVALTDKFMKAVEEDREYKIISPETGKVVNKLDARRVWDLIVTMAWKSGDPGIIFIDRINNTESNPTPKLGLIESTNPCGESPLLPYESCNLGSLNLSKFILEKDGKKDVDFEKLKDRIWKAVHFLDNVIDMNRYPLPQIEEITKNGNRKIGLGVMGFADLLIHLWIPYNSEEAVKLADKVMKFIDDESKLASTELAKKRGSFHNFKKSIWPKKGYKALRNAVTTVVAPTGTISIISGCSSGIEPIFAVSYIRNILDQTELLEINPIFEKAAKEKGFYSEELMRLVARQGSIHHVKEIPEDVKKIFVTTHDIGAEDHVKVQAAFQKHVDLGVSKTVNFPNDATVEDVEKVYMMAYKMGCKGITIYRDRSKSEQVLNIELVRSKIKPKMRKHKPTASTPVQKEKCETC
ncbi:MAG TPA: vitamin B12-dependent ribonucleotide reductase [archaeon]|nr:vitamin B12-dependent ribonucleotide reductase [archaeon]